MSPRSVRLRRAIGTTLLIAAAACDTGVSPADVPDAAPSPACLEAPEHSDLAWIQDEIFTPSCASFRACHLGNASSAGGLNLEAGQSQANLVGVPSQLFPEYQMVAPGDPQASYLLIIVGGAEGPLSADVGTMPLQSDLLCSPKREAIARWIASLPAP